MHSAKEVVIHKKIPLATYRLQLNRHFTFRQAIELIDYLKDLGISHCYCSPILKAKKGSLHGYDLVDPFEINPEIGTKEEFILFAKKLKENGMGLILDIVPNHMFIASDENKWWQDVLKNGPASSFAKYFDIDWENGQLVIPPFVQEHGRHYRIVDWHSDELNYRKFFDIQSYAGIRIEDPEVYRSVHALIFELKELVDGLRIDHIDGLYDPFEYLKRLHKDFPGYKIVEKILAPHEKLPEDWPVEGTVGYDFLNENNGLFIFEQNCEKFRSIYESFTNKHYDVPELSFLCKKLILETSLSAEIRRLAKGHEGWKKALRTIIALFPVYRTYIRPGCVSDKDYKIIKEVLFKAKQRFEDFSILDGIESILLNKSHTEFAQRLQQVTGPAMAKGIEDTAFYRFYPLASLDEVGNDLNSFGVTLEAFHKKNQNRPLHSMLASSTHDTKRSEDVRARLNVLSEIPEVWRDHLQHWVQMNGDDIDRNEQYLLYQNIVGSWTNKLSSDYISRIKEFMRKAVNEAKIHSSWLHPNEEYLQLVENFVEKIFANTAFIASLSAFVGFLNPLGLNNSISQTLIKLTSPGVPDIYQGCELWNFTLVDPDNRRPVDFSLPKEDCLKYQLIKKTLQCRKEHCELFANGDYMPLYASGPLKNHVIAFERRYSNKIAITVAGRFFSFVQSWEGTQLDLSGSFINIFSGENVSHATSLADLFKRQPAALLIGNLQ